MYVLRSRVDLSHRQRSGVTPYLRKFPGEVAAPPCLVRRYRVAMDL